VDGLGGGCVVYALSTEGLKTKSVGKLRCVYSGGYF
jgi:hypothetical protein